MAERPERDLSRIGWLDYVLMSIGSCLAVYSAGMSIQIPAVSYFCMVLVILGAVVSYGIRVLTINSPWIKLDALFYSAAVIAAIGFSADLRMIMPEGGFPREIAAAGWLSWMLILGSFATWQDSTLLFQAIPALALFGLIGCYDTYRPVTLAFFAFLICLATLFARAHGREMLRKAADSGYFTRGLAPGTPIPSVETTPGLALKLKKGPWRWIAGPEWALASALAVVLISLLGAPVIQDSVSGVAGFVKINQPPVRPRNNPATGPGADNTGLGVRIGRPYIHTLSRPLIQARLDRLRYLRSETYNTYTGRGWFNSAPNTVVPPTDTVSIKDLGLKAIKDPREFVFDVQLLRPLHILPLPPEVIDYQLKGPGVVDGRDDGTYGVGSTEDQLAVTGSSAEPDPGFTPTSVYTGPGMGPFLSKVNIPERVQVLAKQVSEHGKNDFERAKLLQQEISKRIVYNLDADETPSDQDPVEYTLFVEKQGYCTAFASAMVLMSRSVGIPARYVQGYLPDERRHQQSGPYIVTDADYHAWAELFFKDAGWVVFDPTIGAASIDGEGLGDSGDERPWYMRGVMVGIFNVMIVLAAIGFGLAGLAQYRSYRRNVNVRTELDRTYIGFNRRLERFVGRRRTVGQTSEEFLKSIRVALGSLYGPAREINDRFERAFYSSETVAAGSVTKLRSDVAELGKKLKQAPRQAKHQKL